MVVVMVVVVADCCWLFLFVVVAQPANLPSLPSCLRGTVLKKATPTVAETWAAVVEAGLEMSCGSTTFQVVTSL